MDTGKILIVNLSKGALGEENMSFLGLLLVQKLLAAALSREDVPEGERKDFFFYADEFQNFATQEFASILSEARKYRLNLTLAHQYIGQLPEDIKMQYLGM
jgi:type IV secretory pathway TraG/TraD family ATPase VirD4